MSGPPAEIPDKAEFSRQVATLRDVATAIGEDAICPEQMEIAQDLVGLLRYLNQFDEGIN